jgi:hypothetical protein
MSRVMEKVQRLNGYGHERMTILNDCLRYSLSPSEKMISFRAYIPISKNECSNWYEQ